MKRDFPPILHQRKDIHMAQKNVTRDMTQGSPLKLILTFSLPLLGGFLFAAGGYAGLGAAHPICLAGNKSIHPHDRHTRCGTGGYAAISPHAQVDFAHAAAGKRLGHARHRACLLPRQSQVQAPFADFLYCTRFCGPMQASAPTKKRRLKQPPLTACGGAPLEGSLS